MNANKHQMSKSRTDKIGGAVVVTVFYLLFSLPGVCFSSQPSGNDPAAFRQAGLNKDRTQLPALLTALQKPNDPFEHPATLSALRALAQMGATEALPVISTLTNTSHDTSLVNFATAAKARILAESGAQAIKDPKARARAEIAALYQQTKLTPDALNLDAKYYQAHIGTPGEPVPLGVCVMREAADVLYQEGVASSAVEATPSDYSLDPAAALKVRLADMSPQARLAAMIEDLTDSQHRHVEPKDYYYELQLAADMGVAAEQTIDAKLVDMDLHPDRYDSLGFTALFNVLRGIADSSQSSFIEDFVSDPSRAGHNAAEAVLADVLRGNKALYAVGY